jgi:hypothetical protein
MSYFQSYQSRLTLFLTSLSLLRPSAIGLHPADRAPPNPRQIL